MRGVSGDTDPTGTGAQRRFAAQPRRAGHTFATAHDDHVPEVALVRVPAPPGQQRRDSAPADTPVLDRASIPAGRRISGPAIIESLESTILAPPQWVAEMGSDGFVSLMRAEGQSEGQQ